MPKRKTMEEENGVPKEHDGGGFSAAMEVETDGLPSNRWADLDKLLLRKTPFGSETGPLPLGEFEPGEETKDFLMGQDCRVLVIGAGGLGCEILKDLALSGFTRIDVIDLDTIDVSNLNRQFLFRQKDVGRPKADVAAEFIRKRVPGVEVTPHYKKIQDFDQEFYLQFNLVISGLDNLEARRWLNSMLCSLVAVDDAGEVETSTVIPFIDGGTEGFKGQARVILPRVTSCFECSLDMFPPQKVFPMCTIAETPRMPEHCISYASLLQWPQAFPDKKLDKDCPENMRWVFERAAERAEQHNIKGVTYMLTIGVVKNIIPAVASTNAVVAAACVSEGFKAVTACSQTLNTYVMYMGSTGVYGHTFAVEKRADCAVCGSRQRIVTVPATMTLADFIATQLVQSDLRATKPSLRQPKRVLYMQNPPALRKQTEKNLESPMGDLCESGDAIVVTDPAWEGIAIDVVVRFAESA
ncbi:unnamed protein product [Phaeothamnion confervicola]